MGKTPDVKHVNDTMNASIAAKANVPSVTEAIKKLAIDIQLPFIEADAYIADPYALLGQVFQIRKVEGKCPTSMINSGFSIEMTPYPIPRKINEASKLSKPSLRESIIVDQNLAAKVGFLSYLSASLDANSSYSLIVFDQAAGLIDTQDPAWRPGLKQWEQENQDLISDNDICYLFAVVGFIQKNIVRKKYTKYKGKLGAGAYGININGELSTGTDQYSLDVKFGLTPIVIKRPGNTTEKSMGITGTTKKTGTAPTVGELKLFAGLTGGKITRKAKKQVLVRKDFK